MRVMLSLDETVVTDLITYLTSEAPGSGEATRLLRHLSVAMQEGRKGFTPPPVDEELYRNAPPFKP